MSETVTRVFGIIPHRPDWLQRRIQMIQRSLSIHEPFASITHVGIEHGGLGIEMVLWWGRLFDVESKYGKSNQILYSVYGEGQPPHLFSNAVLEMYHRPYAGLQLVGLMLNYWFESNLYDKLPNWLKRTFEVCCEGVTRSYNKCGIKLPWKADNSLPAWFFMPPFKVMENNP